VEPNAKRVYPEGELAAHLLGFVNDNGNGFYGIEGYYDTLLKGKAGICKKETAVPLGI
jgi:cell division protein FtsI (penicillin-binding protein 3)